jgi:type IV secretory pathway VirB2 component (pilin)
VLAQLPVFTLITWGLAILLTLALLVRMIALGQHRIYPLFTLYLACNVLQAAVIVYLYQWYGFASMNAYRIAWTTQAFAVVARAFAATEVCRQILGKFTGVWAMSARILVVCGVLVLCAALYFGRSGYQLAVITIEIGLESFVATWIVGLFCFARYYEVQIPTTTGLVGLGLGLISCFRILNDVVFERFVKSYLTAWNHASLLVFIAILLIWIRALRQPIAAQAPELQLSAGHEYQALMPQVNRRLIELNDQLSHLWPAESTRP